MLPVKVWSLDVWGNEEEWVVNDRREVATIEIQEDATDEELFIILQDYQLLRKDIKLSDISVMAEDFYTIFIDSAEGYPLYQLDIIEEG